MYHSEVISYSFLLILFFMTSGGQGNGLIFEIMAPIVPGGFCSTLSVTLVTRRPELTCGASCLNEPLCLAASIDGAGVCTLWNCSAPATNDLPIYQVYDYCSHATHLCLGNDMCVNQKGGYSCIETCLATQIRNPNTERCQDKLTSGHAEIGVDLMSLDGWSRGSAIDLRSGPLNNSLITEFNFYIKNYRGTVRLGAVKQWTADTFLFLHWISPTITTAEFNLGYNSVDVGGVEVEENAFLLLNWSGGSNVPFRYHTAGDNCIKSVLPIPGLNYTFNVVNRNYGYGITYINL